MRRTTAVLAAAVLCAWPLAAQQETRPLSPRDSALVQIDTAAVSVQYSRPSMRGRKIFGGLVPWNQVWRTGANEATHLRTTGDLLLGGVPVPRGTYTLWTIPRPEGWVVIVNRQTGIWGTRYDSRFDLVRFEARAESTPSPVETFTVALDKTGPSSGVLRLFWENTAVVVPFERNDRIRPLSPLDSVDVRLGGQRLAVHYSRPYKRGRTIWGNIVPMDSVWRTGANAATVLTAGADILLGGKPVPRGVYTLYTIPSGDTCTLIVSGKAPGQASYDPAQDVVRVPMRREPADGVVDPFTIGLEPSGGGVKLRFGWDDRWYTTVATPDKRKK